MNRPGTADSRGTRWDALRGKVAIVGVGTTAQGELPDQSADEIAVDAFALALADAKLTKADIDGLITCKSFGGFGIDTEIGQLAGLNPRYSATLDYGTCNFSLHLATMAIATGMASTVAIMYGTNQRTSGNRFATGAGSGSSLYEPHGFLNIAGQAAMTFRRHAYLYGTTEEQLGHVAVNQRKNAQLNPLAIFTDDLSLDDYLGAPYLVAPLRRPDVCMISDGGACLIVTAAERAAGGPHDPVYVLGMDQVTGLRLYENPDNLMRPWVRELGESIYPRAGLSREDIDVLFIQDPTSVWVLQMLEWFGFCEVGAGGPFVADGNTQLHGSIPVNTNGGQLSESYMWGWLHLCEAVRQLRGDCDARQVKDARFALYCSTKGFEKSAASILGTHIPA
jgi:acetyl-CoA acetyltransferase